MKPTTAWMKKNFKYFNEKYFENSLITPNFKVTNAFHTIGQACWERVNGVKTYTIKMTQYYDRSEHDLQETLLHEMIHIQQFMNGENGHGASFKKKASYINADGWNISHYTPAHLQATKKLENEIRVVTFIDKTNRRFICALANNCKLDNYIKKAFADVKFYTTNDPKIGGIKRCRKNLSGVAVNEDEFRTNYLPNFREVV